jgi:hypothetical protein
MSVTIKIKVGKQAVVEAEVGSVKEAIQALSPYYEVFGEAACGKCGSEQLAVNHREAGGYDYYSLRCLSCSCQLDFGQHQQGGTLFPKRKLPDGSWDSQNQGWYHWKDRKEDKPSTSNWE